MLLGRGCIAARPKDQRQDQQRRNQNQLTSMPRGISCPLLVGQRDAVGSERGAAPYEVWRIWPGYAAVKKAPQYNLCRVGGRRLASVIGYRLW
jgi:hypothetical protein